MIPFNHYRDSIDKDQYGSCQSKKPISFNTTWSKVSHQALQSRGSHTSSNLKTSPLQVTLAGQMKCRKLLKVPQVWSHAPSSSKPLLPARRKYLPTAPADEGKVALMYEVHVLFSHPPGRQDVTPLDEREESACPPQRGPEVKSRALTSRCYFYCRKRDFHLEKEEVTCTGFQPHFCPKASHLCLLLSSRTFSYLRCVSLDARKYFEMSTFANSPLSTSSWWLSLSRQSTSRDFSFDAFRPSRRRDASSCNTTFVHTKVSTRNETKIYGETWRDMATHIWLPLSIAQFCSSELQQVTQTKHGVVRTVNVSDRFM